MLHSKKFFDLLRVGCCFYNCLSFSHFFLISLPAVLPATIILLHHTHTHTHHHFSSTVGSQPPCPRAVPWTHGWWLPIYSVCNSTQIPGASLGCFIYHRVCWSWGSLPLERALLTDFKIHHIELMIPFTGFDHDFLISQRICWQITAVHQNWILKFKVK